MAVTFDLSDVPEMHPSNRREIAYRLALAAQAIAYDRDIPYSGPIYQSMSIEGDRIRVGFQHAEGGLKTKGSGDNAPLWFEVAGADHKFEFAEAKIEGETVVVSSRKVPSPVAVRYGFSWLARCNLYNRSGLPASHSARMNGRKRAQSAEESESALRRPSAASRSQLSNRMIR